MSAPLPAGEPAWQLFTFDALDTRTLYALLRLRSEVFVVEQACVFQDIDGLDPQALHLTGWSADGLVAYARCFPAGVSFAEASIGRVVTSGAARGAGWGHLLIDEALRVVLAHWGRQPVRIGAQARLKDFYQRHGFVDVGMPYVEDGIDHLEMVWTP
ncbi:MAG: GNAT family N-acetyltransferase [Rhodoferax sp.]|jgi:ElaA protein|nr:GNAT family N-acetyltransferase [Rhodoferax sp.]